MKLSHQCHTDRRIASLQPQRVRHSHGGRTTRAARPADEGAVHDHRLPLLPPERPRRRRARRQRGPSPPRRRATRFVWIVVTRSSGARRPLLLFSVLSPRDETRELLHDICRYITLDDRSGSLAHTLLIIPPPARPDPITKHSHTAVVVIIDFAQPWALTTTHSHTFRRRLDRSRAIMDPNHDALTHCNRSRDLAPSINSSIQLGLFARRDARAPRRRQPPARRRRAAARAYRVPRRTGRRGWRRALLRGGARAGGQPPSSLRVRAATVGFARAQLPSSPLRARAAAVVVLSRACGSARAVAGRRVCSRAFVCVAHGSRMNVADRRRPDRASCVRIAARVAGAAGSARAARRR